MALIFAFLAFFGWGIGDIFGTIASRKIGAFSTTVWFSVIQFLIFIIFAPFYFSELENLTPVLLVVNLALGLTAVLASATFYEAVKSGNASLAGTIVSSFVGLTVILSIVFLGERISSAQAISIVIIFVGIVTSSLNFSDIKQKQILKSKGIQMAFVSMVLWGIYWAFLKIPVREIGWYWPIVFSQIVYFLLPIFMMVKKIKLQKPNTRSLLTILILNSLILGIGSFSYNLGIERGLVAVVAPIAGAYSVLFVVIANFVFKEPLTRKEGIGIIVTLAGIILLSFFSV